ncbi:hypothetical protein BJ170DRAFT_599226 [Xylariales sp. AK1849]|nr:hypothetical protein BJ170DRAFT_599226 [Xylariales sp. AK1849]
MYTAINPFTETATFQIGSRLIPREVITHFPKNFTTTLQEITEYGSWISGVSFSVSRAPTVPNSVNPAFRESSVSLVVGTLNKGDPWEPEWQTVFYGNNYERLLEIKDRYDPDRILYARTTVGSENWAKLEDGRLYRI